MIDDFLGQLASGTAVSLFVEGEAGIGKTRLLAEAATRASQHGIRVLGGTEAVLQRHQWMETLKKERTSPAPALLVVDDLHLADPRTLATLHALTRRLADRSLGVLAASRFTACSGRLSGIASDPRYDRSATVALGPLDQPAFKAVVANLAGGVPDDDLLAELARTAGNPFLIIETVRALVDGGLVVIDGGQARLSSGAATSPPPAATSRLLSHLSPATIDLLRLASVLGSSFDVSDLIAVTKSSTVDVIAALQEAVNARVLESGEHRLRFRQELVQEVLYLDLPPTLRRSLHVETGRALAASNAPAMEVAHHLSLGSPPAGEEVHPTVPQAVVTTILDRPEQAVNILRRAAQRLGADDPLRHPLLAELITAYVVAGRVREAENMARTVSHCLSPQLTGSAALALLYAGDQRAAETAAQSAIERARDVGGGGVALALCSLANAALLRGRTGEAVRHANAAVELSSLSAPGAAERALCPLFLALALMDADRLEEAEASLLSDGIARGPAMAELLSRRRGLLWIQFARGVWHEAIGLAQDAARCAEAGAVPFWSASTLGLLAVVAVHRNDMEAAERAMAEGEVALRLSGPQYRWGWLSCARALIEEARGHHDEALSAVEAAWRTCEATGLSCEFVVLGPDLVRLRMAHGKQSQAIAAVHQVEEIAEQMATPWAHGTALRCRGVVEGDAGLSIEAASVLGRAQRPLDHALALEEAGTALVREGRNDDAAAFLARAVETHEGLGARRDVARVEAQLRSIGVPRGRRGPRKGRPRAGWESLTPTERAVVAAVTEGLTNREVAERLYISPRTVETHLSHVFFKLGLPSRTALKKEAARRANSPSNALNLRADHGSSGWYPTACSSTEKVTGKEGPTQ